VLSSVLVHVMCGVVHQVYMYELCCILGVCVYILWHNMCVDACLVMYIVYLYVRTLGVGICVVCQV